MAVPSWIHPVLRAAVQSAREEDRIGPPFHLDGPRPELDSRGILRLSAWMADLLRPLVDRERVAAFDRALSLVRETLAGSPSPLHLLQRAAEEAAPDRDPTAAAMAHHAVQVATLWSGGARGAINAAPIAAAHASRLLSVTKPAGVPDARTFQRRLDLELCRLEMEAALAEHGEKSAVASVTWRATSRTKADHFLGVLADGRCALLYRHPRRRWILVAGSEEETLASLPDAHFETVTRRLAR